MRGLILFLLCTAGVVAANPLFWEILAMEQGVTTYQLVEADGAVRQVIHGPKGPWPQWAPAPGAEPVRPAASYSAAPGHPATGFGDAAFAGEPLAAARAMKGALEEAGWTVEERRVEGVEPSLPPQRLVLCDLSAWRADHPERRLLYAFQVEPPVDRARVHWFEGLPHPPRLDPPTDCAPAAAEKD